MTIYKFCKTFSFFQLFGNNLVSASYDCTVVVSRLPEGILQENDELLQEKKKENNFLQDNNELSQTSNSLLQENKSPDVQEKNTPLSSNPLTKCFTEEDVRQVSKVQVEKYFLKLEISRNYSKVQVENLFLKTRHDCPQPRVLGNGLTPCFSRRTDQGWSFKTKLSSSSPSGRSQPQPLFQG